MLSISEALEEHDNRFVSIRTLIAELAEIAGRSVNDVARWMKLVGYPHSQGDYLCVL